MPDTVAELATRFFVYCSLVVLERCTGLGWAGVPVVILAFSPKAQSIFAIREIMIRLWLYFIGAIRCFASGRTCNDGSRVRKRSSTDFRPGRWRCWQGTLPTAAGSARLLVPGGDFLSPPLTEGLELRLSLRLRRLAMHRVGCQLSGYSRPSKTPDAVRAGSHWLTKMMLALDA